MTILLSKISWNENVVFGTNSITNRPWKLFILQTRSHIWENVISKPQSLTAVTHCHIEVSGWIITNTIISFPPWYVTGSWKTYLLGTSKLWENLIENLLIFSNKAFSFQIWIKQLLNLLGMKFHTKSFFFLGDMDDCIRPTNVPKR